MEMTTVDEATTQTAVAPATPAVLEVRGVTKTWPGAPAPVLATVDLSVEPGTAVGIAGRNGAGKTTLLRIAGGLLAPDAGVVRIQGMDPERSRTQCQRRIGVCSAGNSGLYGRLGVRAHLDLWARLALMPRRRRGPAIDAALESFMLGEFGNRRVDRLSMGQRQRLRLALAFLHGPDLLLLDEPRTSLDSEGWELTTTAIDRVRARGGAVVMCFPSGDPDPVVLSHRYEVRDATLTRT